MIKVIKNEEALLKFLPIHDMQKFDYPLEVEKHSSRALLNGNYLTLLLRYPIVRDWDNEIEGDYGYDVYKQYLDKYNTSNSGGESGEKNCFNDWLEEFYETYNSVRKNGFDSTRNVIALDRDGINLGGSHRIAIGLDEDMELSCVKSVSETTGKQYCNYKALKGRNFNTDILYDVICNYVTFKPENIYCAILYPTGKKHYNELLSSLRSNGASIVCEEEFSLSKSAIEKLSLVSYTNTEWLNIPKKGVMRNLRVKRYAEGVSTKVVVFHMNSLDDVLEIKATVRNKIGLGKEPLHITDTSEEAVVLIRQLFNRNGLNFLNASEIPKESFWRLLCKYSEENKHDANYMLLDKACLGAFGICDVKELEYYTVKEQLNISNLIRVENSECGHSLECMKKMLNNPKYYFYANGVKILAPKYAYEFLKNRGSEPNLVNCSELKRVIDDKQDTRLLEFYKNSVAFLKFDIVFGIARILQKYPKIYYPIRNLYKKLFKVLG